MPRAEANQGSIFHRLELTLDKAWTSMPPAKQDTPEDGPLQRASPENFQSFMISEETGGLLYS